MLLCHGTQIFPRNPCICISLGAWFLSFIWALSGMQHFVVNCLGSNNSSFEEFPDGIVLLIRQSLDYSHSGNHVLGKHTP